MPITTIITFIYQLLHVEAQPSPPLRHSIVFLYVSVIVAFLLGLYTYWFVIANRYLIFLYGHLGATPFDARTSSRYWMAGLIATGLLAVLYTLLHWFLGRMAGLRRRLYAPPSWQQLWLCAALPLAAGILLITMTQNRPTLPLSLAAALVAATLGGLALALWPAAWAAQKPAELTWLVLLGAGLMPTLLLLRAVELPSQGLVAGHYAYTIALGGSLVGWLWLLFAIWLRRRRRMPEMDWRAICWMGVGLSYLLMPLVHYLLFTPPAYRYLTASTNFFAFDWRMQGMVLLAAVLMAWFSTRTKRALNNHNSIVL
jgi:hypothetical protein